MVNWNSSYTPVIGHFVITLNGARDIPAGAIAASGAAPTLWNNAGIYETGAAVMVFTGVAPTVWNNASIYATGAGAATMAGEVPVLAVA